MCADMLHKSEGLLGTVRAFSPLLAAPFASAPLTCFSSTWIRATERRAMKQHNTCQPPGRPLAYMYMYVTLARPPIACHFFIPQRILQSVSMPHADTTGGPPRGRSLPPTGPAGGGQPADDRARTCMLHRVETHGTTFFIFRTQHKTQTQSFSHINIIDSTISFDRQLDTTTATTTFPQP